MSAPNRSAQITKLHKVLKKYYTPAAPDPKRPVLEQLLFGCLLENASQPVAEEAYAALVHGFFDWNEIRVTSIRELAEAMPGLPDPMGAANRVKRVLQNVFEASYAFDLEELRKQNLGPAVERLKKIDGVGEFAVAYVVQSALGGHSIPLDSGTLGALYCVDLVSEENAKEGVVPGLERAVPKAKGSEFASLLHQLGADFLAAPHSPQLREILVQIDPIAEERLPKRRPKKTDAEPSAEAVKTPAPPAEPPAKKATDAGHAEKASRKKESPPAAAPAPAPEPAKKTPAAPKKADEKTAKADDKAVKPAPEKPKAEKSEKPAKPVEKVEKAEKPRPVAKKPPKAPPAAKKKNESAELAKRKPR